MAPGRAAGRQLRPELAVLPRKVAGSKMKVGDERAQRCDPIKAVPGLSQSLVP